MGAGFETDPELVEKGVHLLNACTQIDDRSGVLAAGRAHEDSRQVPAG